MPIPRIWQPRPCDDARVEVLSRELGVSSTTARLLCIRDLSEPDAARRFLSPSLKDLHDPFLLVDMDKTHNALNKANKQTNATCDAPLLQHTQNARIPSCEGATT